MARKVGPISKSDKKSVNTKGRVKVSRWKNKVSAGLSAVSLEHTLKNQLVYFPSEKMFLYVAQIRFTWTFEILPELIPKQTQAHGNSSSPSQPLLL